MGCEGTTTLYEQLHKLAAIESEQELQNFLQLLWRTRKTGLHSSDKSSLQFLLKLPSLAGLDPVLACVRSLLRKCERENLDGDGILKLLPHDLPLELQSMLLVSLQKYQNQWNLELSQEQHLLGSTRFSHQLNAELPSLPSFSSSEVCGSSWYRQVNPVPQLNGQNVGGPTSINASCSSKLPLQNDISPSDILGTLPRLKSMAWTVENKNKVPANRVAVITLKLQDYTKSPAAEMEVKFQLSRDTLEAMLRSMTYINEQLSRSAGSAASVPVQKKQRM